jgi:hypothetical protein
MNYLTTKIVQKHKDKLLNGGKLTKKENVFYRDINYRKGNLPFVYTNDEMIEMTNCISDPIHFIETHLGLILYEYQKEWIFNFIDNKFSLNFTSRQVGFTTILSALYLWYMTFHNKKILIISNKLQNSISFIDKLKNYYESLPFFLKCGILTNNNNSFQFDNGSSIKIMASVNSVYGSNYDIYSYLDFSLIPDNRSNFDYIYPIISTSTNSKINIQSGSNGINTFSELLSKSELPIGDPDKNEFSSIRTYWWQVPGRDLNWKNEMIKTVGQDIFDKEYDLCFVSKKLPIGTGNITFTPPKLTGKLMFKFDGDSEGQELVNIFDNKKVSFELKQNENYNDQMQMVNTSIKFTSDDGRTFELYVKNV